MIARLCCSIDQPSSSVQSETTNNITGQSTVTELLSFSGQHDRHTRHMRNVTLHGGRRRSALTSRRSTDTAKPHLSMSAVDFYFRSLLAATPATGFDFRYPKPTFSGSRVFPVLNSCIARPRPMRLVPRFPAFLPTGSGILGRPGQVSNQFASAFGQQFPSPLISCDSRTVLPLNLRWYSTGIEYASMSRNFAVKRTEIVTSPEESGTSRDRLQAPSAVYWNPSSSVCLRSLPWQPTY